MNSSGQNKRNTYSGFNYLRVFACLSIVLMHVQSNLELSLPHNILFDNIIPFSANFVLLFMMVSSFCMCCGYYYQFKDGNINITAFYRKRFLRLFPFFAALVILDILFAFVSKDLNTITASCFEGFADMTLLFNLIPNNGIEVIGVGWFIGVIAVFNIFFPFFTYLIHSKSSTVLSVLISVALYFAGLLYFMPVKGSPFENDTFLKVAPYFMSGGAIYVSKERIVYLFRSNCRRIILGVVVVLSTILFYIFPEYRFPLSNMLLYSTWIILAIILNHSNKVISFLSSISMELYLCHMLSFRIVEKAHVDRIVDNGVLCYLIISLLVFCISIMICVAWKKIFEARINLLLLRLFMQ